MGHINLRKLQIFATCFVNLAQAHKDTEIFRHGAGKILTLNSRAAQSCGYQGLCCAESAALCFLKLQSINIYV